MKILLFSLAGGLIAFSQARAVDANRLKDASLLDFIKENRGKSQDSINDVIDELIDLRAQPQTSNSALDEEIKKLNAQKRLIEHLSKQLSGHYGLLSDKQADSFSEIWQDATRLSALKNATAAAKFEGPKISISENSPYQFVPKAYLDGNQLKVVYDFQIDEARLKNLPYYSEVLSHYGSTASIKSELEKLMNVELSKKEIAVTITDEMKKDSSQMRNLLRRNFAPLHEGLLKSDRGVGAQVAQELTKLDNEVKKKETRKGDNSGAARSRDLAKISQLEQIAKFLKSSASAGQDPCKTIYNLKLWDSLSEEERESECTELNDKLKAKTGANSLGHSRSATNALSEAAGLNQNSNQNSDKPLSPMQQFNAQMQYMQALNQTRAQENMAQCFSKVQSERAMEPLKEVAKLIEPMSNSLLTMRGSSKMLSILMSKEKPGFAVDYTTEARLLLEKSENSLEANLKLKSEKETLEEVAAKSLEAMTKWRLEMTGVMGTFAEPGTPDFESAKGYYRARLEQSGATMLQVDEALRKIAQTEARFIEMKKTSDAAIILRESIDRTLDSRKITARATNFRDVSRDSGARSAGVPTVGAVPGQLNTPAPLNAPSSPTPSSNQGPNFLGTGR